MAGKIVIVFGASGVGKTMCAEQIARMFGCACIVDGWLPGDQRRLRRGTLVLTSAPPPYRIAGPIRVFELLQGGNLLARDNERLTLAACETRKTAT